MSIRLHTYNLKAASEKPTPADMAVLSEADFAGEDADPSTLIVRRMLLCHDQYDRTFERFPKDYLQRFVETLPGKSVLPGHDTSQLPLARFHAAKLSRIDEPEFPVLVTRERKSAETVAGFDKKAARVSYLDARFYYPASDTVLNEKISAGVYRSVSIGFRYDDVQCDVCKKSYFSDCPHLAGRWTDEGRLATLTYSGDAQKAEALEGSIVYLGAQPQARLVKQAADMVQLGAVDPDALARVPLYGETDLVTLKWAEQLAREHGHQRKNWHFAATVAEGVAGEPAEETDSMDFLKRLQKLLGVVDTATEDETLAAAEKALGAVEATLAASIKTIDELTPLAAKATEATEKLAAREPLAKIGETALADQAKAYVDHCIRLEQPEVEAKAVSEMFVAKGDYVGLKGLVEAKWEQVCKRYPAGISGDPAATGETGDGKRTMARPDQHSII